MDITVSRRLRPQHHVQGGVHPPHRRLPHAKEEAQV